MEIRNDSKKELDKAFNILHDNPYLKLVISAHADDQGRESYNQRLSAKRANNVESFLAKLGIDEDRMFTFAFGESSPVIPCQVQKCDENDHSKNRRAELSLTIEKPHANFVDVIASEEQIDKKAKTRLAESQKVKLSYGEIVDQYGEKRIDGLAFKISISAYRYNPNLTFDELHDLGDVQKKFEDGINYYSLAEFYDLKAAEEMRKEVICRGIEDAFIKIYFRDKIIPFSPYLQLVRGNNDL